MNKRREDRNKIQYGTANVSAALRTGQRGLHRRHWHAGNALLGLCHVNNFLAQSPFSQSSLVLCTQRCHRLWLRVFVGLPFSPLALVSMVYIRACV
jgi:hypothetical protein